TTTSNQTASSYTVVSGDYLSKIANQFGVSVAQLKTWNNLSSDLILVGQKLTVKASSDQTTQNTTIPSQPTSTTTSNQTASSYTVVSGDYLSKIANQFGVSVAQLKTWNNLSSDLILVGQKLTVRASSDQTTQNTTTSNTTTSSQTYKVVSGDNLWTIAQRNNLSLQTLKQMNQLTSDTIFIGQVLKLK
ncbi:LysM peptidoglycan-binding domain-containing protein, partial [Enterococcus bulliens]